MATAGIVDVTEQKRLNDAREQGIPWKKWGPYLSERQWGTVREDYSDDGNAWDYFSHDQSRSRAYRWGEDGLGGISRRQAAAVLRARAVERARPDPQGAPVRAHQQRGQPRRGREGVLLLRRQHADALVHEVPLQVPAARVPVSRSGRDQRGAARARSSSTSCSTPASSTTTATSTCSSSTRRRARRHPRPDHRAQPRARGGAAARAADAVVPQHLVVGRRRSRSPSLRAGRAGRRSRPRTTSSATYIAALRRRRRSCCSPRTRPTPQRLWGQPNASPYVKDAFHRYVVAGQRDAVNPARDGHEGGGALRARRARRRQPDGPAAALRRRPSAGAVRRLRRRSFDDAARRGRRVLRRGSRRRRSTRTSAASTGRRWPACCGASSSTTSTSSSGSASTRATRCSSAARPACGTPSGSTCSTPTSSRCPTSGSTRGTRRGTSRSTPSRSRSSTSTSRRTSCC